MRALVHRWWPAMSTASPVDSGRWVTSWRLWLLLMPLSVLSLTSHLLDETPFRGALLTAFVSTLASGLVLVVASITVLRNRREVRPPDWLSSLVWFLVGVVAYLVGEAITTLLFNTSDSPIHMLRDMFRFSTAVLMRTAFIVIGLSALLKTQDSLASLERAFIAQRDELAQTESYLAELRTRYVTFVTEAIEPRLHSLMSEVELIKAGPRSAIADGLVADELEDFGSHQVRALSHQIVDLASPSVADNTSATDVFIHVHSGVSLLHGWIREIPPALPWLTLFLFTRLGYGTFAALSYSQAVGYLLFCVLGFLLLTLARLVGQRLTLIPNRAPVWVGSLVLISVALVTVEIGWATGELGDSLPYATSTLVAQAMTTLLAVWIINFILVQRARKQMELTAAARRLQDISDRRDLAAEQLRYRLAGILHGPVQGRLALASMTIRQFAQVQDEDPAARLKALTAVQEILTSIDSELSSLALGAPAARSFGEFIADLQKTWTGVLDIEVRVSSAAEQVMHELPDIRDSAILVAKEAIMNARSHGRARVIFLSVDLRDTGQLQISVLDDGIGAQADQGSGLGSRIFQRATSSWSLTSVGFGGSLFNAIIDLPSGVEVGRQLAKIG